jgi:hypothetical protein
LPIVADEAAYLFQAENFAAGRWSAPAPPLPEFFEQMHVLTSPTFASKYPPGHSLLLVPGMWLGLPSLVPLLLTGLSGALVFLLARRVANPAVGLLSWLLWTTAPGNLVYRPTFFSEVSSSALWLLGWWALLQWRDTSRRGWLLALSASAAWGLLTRPYTIFFFLVPVGIVVIRRVAAQRAWGDFARALALGALLLGMVPLWSAKTTGDWRDLPLLRYNHATLPSDGLGFDREPDPGGRPLPEDQALIRQNYARLTAAHRLQAAPAILGIRLMVIGADMWEGGRLFLIAFAAVGLLSLPREGYFALASAFLMVLGHLLYAHPVDWSLYYLDILPVLAFVTAYGFWKFFATGSFAPPDHPATRLWQRWRVPVAALLLFFGVLWPAFDRARLVREHRRGLAAPLRGFQDALARIPEEKAVVFVRYAPNHSPHWSVITNSPDLSRQRIWVVYDRGAENRKLATLAPDRAAYFYDEATATLRRSGAGG